MRNSFLKILTVILAFACNPAKEEVLYEVDAVDNLGGQTTVRVVLNDRFEADTIVDIARVLRQKYDPVGKFVFLIFT